MKRYPQMRVYNTNLVHKGYVWYKVYMTNKLKKFSLEYLWPGIVFILTIVAINLVFIATLWVFDKIGVYHDEEDTEIRTTCSDAFSTFEC